MHRFRVFAAVLIALTGVPVALAQFTDAHDSSHRAAISYLQSHGLIDGFPDGSFKPRQAMTRAEFLALVLRASGNTAVPSASQCLAAFPVGSWYAPVMCQGLQLGLVSGEPSGLRPDNTVTYSEALKMLLTAYRFELEDATDGPWYGPYVRFASERGIFSALAYRPADFVTREVAANMLYRTMVLAGEFPTVPVAVAVQPEPAAPVSEPTALAEPESISAPACPLALPQPPGSLTVHGRERSLLTHLPAAAGGMQPVPLVVAFHGRTNSNADVRSYMRLEGNGENAIIVYPAGLSAGGNARNWNEPGDNPAELRDYAFFDAIVDYFTDHYCVDEQRIFVVGHSLGAYFANSVACSRPQTVRAVATVAGGIQRGACPGEVAALLFHNPNDTLVAISEGERARDTFLAANQVNSAQPQELSDAFNCSIYGGTNPDRSVTWCVHGIDRPYGDRYDPHSWPAGIGPYVMDFFGSF